MVAACVSVTGFAPAVSDPVTEVSLEEIAERLSVGGLESLDEATVEALAVMVDAAPGDQLVIPLNDEAEAASGPQARAAFLCTATSGNVHKRSSSGKGSVGNKPKTSCSATMAQLYITMVLYKRRSPAILGSVNQGAFGGPTQSARNVKSVELKSVERACTNTKATTWHAINEHVVVDSKGCVYGIVTTAPDVSLTCGT